MSETLWFKKEMVPVMPPLTSDVRADVCVIGAGISGLSVAWHLARENISVVVIDDGSIGGGETGRTTAHIVNALDDRYYDLEKLHGAGGARLAAESHTAAIDRIESIVIDERIDCDFARLDGYLYLVPNGRADGLTEELEAARRAGLIDVEYVDRAPIETFNTGPALRFPRQGQFHPMRYLSGLAHAIIARGGRIHSGAHAVEIDDGAGIVKTKQGRTITCGSIVVATNTPINDRFAIHVKQASYRTYVIAASIPKGVFRQILLWDTSDPHAYAPYHYIRKQIQNDREFLIVGGEDHKTGQDTPEDEVYARLESWTRERFPIEKVEFRWSGQVVEPADGLAFIGLNPGDTRTYIVTGDSGNGITHGTIGGMLIGDLIQGRKNPWTDLYDPHRKRFRALRDYAQENINAMAQYRDWVAPGDVKSVDEIAPGSGAVVRKGLHLVAAYRDQRGQLHERSAVCPHMKGIVSWNAIEKTWDCPAHGSRFTADGDVINGPANSGLKEIEEKPPQGPETIPPAALGAEV